MKLRFITLLALVVAFMSAAQTYVRPKASDGWSVGVNAGMVSPLKGGFARGTRPTVGIAVDKAVTPALSLGVEGVWGINTSTMPGALHSPTAFDSHYIGANGRFDLLSVSSWRPGRTFSFGPLLGAGWGHLYNHHPGTDHNFMAARAGMFFRFAVSDRLAIDLTPSVVWDLSDAHTATSSAAYSARHGVFALQGGVRYSFGPAFTLAHLYDPAQIEALNGEVNTLRSDLQTAADNVSRLENELREARATKASVVKEVVVNNHFNTIYDIFFHMGSATVTTDQMPNVARIASYLQNHPHSRVVIKGYASRDGDRESNLLLSTRRAEAVRTALIKRYHVDPSRITAQGAGIGELFEEDSWNRVSVCTLENE